MERSIPRRLLAALLMAASSPAVAQELSKDWPTYNADFAGTRHNRGETALDRRNVGRLEEKWRFPPKGSKEEIGAVHATPIVVNGCVYFGTVIDSRFYKLAPDGSVRWSYRSPEHEKAVAAARAVSAGLTLRFQSAPDGIFGSALVTDDAVFFADIGGGLYALERKSGAERWRRNAREGGFPGAHPLACLFASPILAAGKVIFAGGTLEQVVASYPGYKGCTGRGFVVALDPKSGEVAWKYDVGPPPAPLEPPITIKDSWGEHVFYFGPATSSVWCTPSFDPQSGALFFGTDVNTAPRWPTPDDPRRCTRDSCAFVALDASDGSELWITQVSEGDVWTNAMRTYDPKERRYKDQSIGDTPKIYRIEVDGAPTTVVGAGCKNGGFYVLRAADGRVLGHTPLYTGPPAEPLDPKPDPRTLALPSCIGGLQTGCATDGRFVYTNGIDALMLGSQESPSASRPPTAGRVVALSLDARAESWRHDRPKVASIGGPPPKPVFRDVGDPVASGIAVANGVLFFTAVASGNLVALDASSGALLKEIELGPVWSGPSVSRGRVYVGTGNTLFSPADDDPWFPKSSTGILFSFGLPGDDEVSRMGAGNE